VEVVGVKWKGRSEKNVKMWMGEDGKCLEKQKY